MPLEPIYQELTPLDIPLDQVLLDPNNPRFVEFNADYVPDAAVVEAQDKTMALLMGNAYQVDKLMLNMEVNGYLPIDRVVVRRLAEEQYVVLEGNRRVAAAKQLKARFAAGNPDTYDVSASFANIPCLVYTGEDPEASWIFQGLRHISGSVEWSAFGKAKLIVEQMQEHDLSLTDVGRRFGLTAHGAGQWVRGFSGFKQAKERSDYVDEIREEAYPFFQELFSQSSSPVREWLQWHEADKEFKNELAFNEFVGWLYPRPPDEDGARGEWAKRRLIKRDDIRSLAYLKREAADIFEQFRGGVELQKAMAAAQARKFEEEAEKSSDPVRETLEVMRDCAKRLDDMPARVRRDAATVATLRDLIANLESGIVNVRELIA